MMQKSLFNVWRSTSELHDSVAAKRIELNQLKLKLKLYSVLNQQVIHSPITLFNKPNIISIFIL